MRLFPPKGAADRTLRPFRRFHHDDRSMIPYGLGYCLPRYRAPLALRGPASLPEPGPGSGAPSARRRAMTVFRCCSTAAHAAFAARCASMSLLRAIRGFGHVLARTFSCRQTQDRRG